MIPWVLRAIFNPSKLFLVYTGAMKRANAITVNILEIGQSIKFLISQGNPSMIDIVDT